MSEKQEGGTLYVGLLSLRRDELLSSSEESPLLFHTDLQGKPALTASNSEAATPRPRSIEYQAQTLIRRHEYVGSSHYSLLPHHGNRSRGYLLRLSKELASPETRLHHFSYDSVANFAKNAEEVERHFLQQILKLMNYRGELAL